MLRLKKWLLNMTIKFNDRKSGPILQSIKNESQILIAEEWMKSDKKRDYKYRPLLLRDEKSDSHTSGESVFDWFF